MKNQNILIFFLITVSLVVASFWLRRSYEKYSSNSPTDKFFVDFLNAKVKEEIEANYRKISEVSIPNQKADLDPGQCQSLCNLRPDVAACQAPVRINCALDPGVIGCRTKCQLIPPWKISEKAKCDSDCPESCEREQKLRCAENCIRDCQSDIFFSLTDITLRGLEKTIVTINEPELNDLSPTKSTIFTPISVVIKPSIEFVATAGMFGSVGPVSIDLDDIKAISTLIFSVELGEEGLVLSDIKISIGQINLTLVEKMKSVFPENVRAVFDKLSGNILPELENILREKMKDKLGEEINKKLKGDKVIDLCSMA